MRCARRARVFATAATMLLVLALGGITPAAAQDANGTLRDAGDHRVLHVWGTHWEMGYAHGFLLGDSILELATGYALELFGLSPEEYETFRGLLVILLHFPDAMEEEAEGLIEGMRDAGVPLYREELGRELDADDVLLINAAADLFGLDLGCSSVSAWGAATEADADLAGELAIARDLDWSWRGDEADLRDHSVVFAFEPSGADQQRWVSVAFPGFIGCLSCINEQGVGALQNQGNHPSSIASLDLTESLVPIHLSLREGIETRDFDGDGQATIHDAVAAVEAQGRLGTYDIHLVSPADRTDPPAAVLECNNTGLALREPTADPLSHPDCLAATNHDRLLHPPEACSRYATIEEMVEDHDGQLDLDRLWEIERAVTKDWGSGGTIQTMRFVPAELRIDVAFADQTDLAPDNPITSYTFAELFEDEVPGDDDDDDDVGDDDDDVGDDDLGDDDTSEGAETGPDVSMGGDCACQVDGRVLPAGGFATVWVLAWVVVLSRRARR